MTVDGKASPGGTMGSTEGAPLGGSEGDGIDLDAGQRMAIGAAWEGIEDKTCYEMLLLPRSADAGAIKKAYYKEARVCHPDKNVGDAEATAKFQKLSDVDLLDIHNIVEPCSSMGIRLLPSKTRCMSPR